MRNTTQSPNSEQKPRRRFFKRAAIATLIGGIAAGIGIKAFAHGGGYGGWHRGSEAERGGHQSRRRTVRVLWMHYAYS